MANDQEVGRARMTTMAKVVPDVYAACTDARTRTV
jgi:hypothetical protein